MPSKTSFFNFALLRKNVLRFSPLWVVYLAGWFVAMPLLLWMRGTGEEPLKLADAAGLVGTELTGGGPAVACVYGLAVAMAVFSYLFAHRSVTLLHSLPIRRGGLFFTNYVSGLLFFLGPNLILFAVTACVTLLRGAFCPGMLLSWLLGLTAMELFFFSFAVFCAMFTGNLLALPIFYAIWNALASVLQWTLSLFVETFLYGFSLDGSSLLARWLTPLYQIYDQVGLNWNYTSDYDLSGVSLEGAPVLAIYAAAGVGFALLAALLYQRRRSESAGDVVSVGWAKVLFRYSVGIMSALVFGQGLYYLVFVSSRFSGVPVRLLCMIVLGAAGFCVAQMLLQKSFRVFKKSLRGSALCAAAILAVALGAYFDVTGFVGRVPQAENIVSVEVNVSGWDTVYMDVESETAIEKVRALHEYIVDNHRTLETTESGWEVEDWINGTYPFSLEVVYHLKDGTTLSRSYGSFLVYADALDDETTLTGLAQAVLDDPEIVAKDTLGELAADEVDGEAITVTGGTFGYYSQGDLDVEREYTLSAAEAQALLAALREDAAAGRFDRLLVAAKAVFDENGDYSYPEAEDRYGHSYANDINFSYEVGTSAAPGAAVGTTQYVSLTADMTATLQALNDLGILNDYVTLTPYEEITAYYEQYYEQEDTGDSAGTDWSEESAAYATEG